MKFLSTIPICFLLICAGCFAQSNRSWGTYYGGAGTELGSGVISTDAFGNVYMAGITDSPNGIAFSGFQNFAGGSDDCFLVKFDSTGNRIWATYYGGSGSNWANDLCVDVFGNIYLAGGTSNDNNLGSGGFQNSPGGGGDAILVKFDPNGNRLWATYYGLSSNESAYGVATDQMGNVYLAGRTTGTTGLAFGGFQNASGGSSDAFLVKFDGAGNRIWATYYGGSGGEDDPSVCTDLNGNVYLGGSSTSAAGISSGGFQNVFAGIQDAYLVKFDGAGNRLWSTYYGGVAYETGWNTAVDAAGNVYLCGHTQSLTGIASGGFQNTFAGVDDAFLVKFDPNGNRIWATYYGGSGTDVGYCLATDSWNNVFLAGHATSTSGIASAGFQNTFTGNMDGFVVMFNAGGNRLCASYYPDTPNELRCGVDIFGDVYLCGVTSNPSSIASGGFQNSLNGFSDAFLVKFTPCCRFPVADISGDTLICSGQTITLSSNGTGTYLWSNGQTNSSITITPSSTTSYTVIVANACGIDTASLTVNVDPSPSVDAGSDITILAGASATLSATGSGPYIWTGGDTNSLITISPITTTIYCVTVTNSYGCSDTDCATVFVECGETFVPTAFSPNGDGLNDVLHVLGKCVKEMKLLIYDRWGEKVFETHNQSVGWDGSFRGKDCDAAVFVYYLKATLIDGSEIKEKGNISLIR